MGQLDSREKRRRIRNDKHINTKIYPLKERAGTHNLDHFWSSYFSSMCCYICFMGAEHEYALCHMNSTTSWNLAGRVPIKPFIHPLSASSLSYLPD